MDAALLQAVTLAIATVGAVLGIINTWRSLNSDRVRVRVDVDHGVAGDGTPCILVTAINLSTFSVTITHVGFDRNDGPTHMQIPRPIFTRGETLPVRLEARTSLTVFVQLTAFEDLQVFALECAYVNTACGRKFMGGRAVLRQVVNAAAARL